MLLVQDYRANCSLTAEPVKRHCVRTAARAADALATGESFVIQAEVNNFAEVKQLVSCFADRNALSCEAPRLLCDGRGFLFTCATCGCCAGSCEHCEIGAGRDFKADKSSSGELQSLCQPLALTESAVLSTGSQQVGGSARAQLLGSSCTHEGRG